MIFGLFVAAACVLVISFLVATVSVLRHNSFLLKAYCAMVALMIVVQLVDGLLAFTYSDQVNQLASDDFMYESLSKAAQKTIPPIGSLSSDAEVQFWANTQDLFGCCGVYNSTDWSVFWGVTGTNNDLQALHCYPQHFNDGCEKTIRNKISSNAQYLGAASMGVLVVEIIASFLAGYRAYTLAHPEFEDK
ncbi:Tetraspanin [Caenorhabditis elegans]|nr:Tetraspanin [Caenorhabditis elegans]CCD65272.1 Tetraspanin [Caenorhabditis elegans]|eukprot:NP_001040806.1 TetraSPanin family [Caenorhabditis elegans]